MSFEGSISNLFKTGKTEELIITHKGTFWYFRVLNDGHLVCMVRCTILSRCIRQRKYIYHMPFTKTQVTLRTLNVSPLARTVDFITLKQKKIDDTLSTYMDMITKKKQITTNHLTVTSAKIISRLSPPYMVFYLHEWINLTWIRHPCLYGLMALSKETLLLVDIFAENWRCCRSMKHHVVIYRWLNREYILWNLKLIYNK